MSTVAVDRITVEVTRNYLITVADEMKKVGDVITVSAGGGHGDPAGCDPETLRRDVELSYVSPEPGRTRYTILYSVDTGIM